MFGDGEMDEPESIAGLTLAAREKLDNLTFVINCNLQRLDGPVRGNGQVIQELESLFTGAGWNVIKVLWGSDWDPLFARDGSNVLLRQLAATVDGQYQTLGANDGAYNQEHFFKLAPELQQLVAHMSAKEIDALKRGGHDFRKLYAAFAAARAHRGQPTVILAKTKKGYGMGGAGESRMVSHQQKKLDEDALRELRNRFDLPLTDADLAALRFLKPADDSREMRYLRAHREALGGAMPVRQPTAPAVPVPPLAFLGAVRAAGRRQGDVDHDGAGADAHHAAARPHARTAHRADRRRRGAHLRHGEPVPPDRHLFTGRPALRARGCRLDARLSSEARDGQLLEEGITEAGVAVRSWRCRGHLVQRARPADAAAVHLLLDLRLPARRRPDLGRRRPARARLPARRDRRPHHAERRGPAAPGRLEPR